jgi:hypothetical protein
MSGVMRLRGILSVIVPKGDDYFQLEVNYDLSTEIRVI